MISRLALTVHRSDFRYPPTTSIEICSVINDGVLALCSTDLEVGETVRLRVPEADIDLLFCIAWVRHSSPGGYKVAMVCLEKGILVWDSQVASENVWIRTEGVRDQQKAIITNVSTNSISFQVARPISPGGRVICNPRKNSIVPFNGRLIASKNSPDGIWFAVVCDVKSSSDWECLWAVTVPEVVDTEKDVEKSDESGLEIALDVARDETPVSMSHQSQVAIVSFLSLFVSAFM